MASDDDFLAGLTKDSDEDFIAGLLPGQEDGTAKAAAANIPPSGAVGPRQDPVTAVTQGAMLGYAPEALAKMAYGDTYARARIAGLSHGEAKLNADYAARTLQAEATKRLEENKLVAPISHELEQGAGALVPLMTGGALLGNAVRGLGGATRAAELWGPNAGLLERTAVRAGVGAAKGAVASAALGHLDPEQSTEQDVALGAGLGAGLDAVATPLLRGTAGYLGSKIANGLPAWAVSSGRLDKLAQQAIGQAAGEDLAPTARTLVPGYQPTLAETAGNAGVSKLQQRLSSLSDYNPLFQERAAANRQVLGDELSRATGTPLDLQTLRAGRRSITPDFAGQQPVDAQPVVDAIDAVLQGDSGKRTAVNQSLTRLRKLLIQKEGEVIADPATGLPTKAPDVLEDRPSLLYQSIRKEIGDMLDKKDLTNPAGKQAAEQLLGIQDELDHVIASGAPGYVPYMQSYRQASIPINAMEWLQGLGLQDAQGNVSLAKLHNALGAQERLAALPGAENAKDVSQAQLDTLRGIRDELLRGKNLSLGTGVKLTGEPGRLAAGPSSSHGPEWMGAGIGGLLGAAHGHGEAGAMAGAATAKLLSGLREGQANAVRQRIVELMLNPENLDVGRTNMLRLPPTRDAEIPVLRNFLLGASE